MYIKVNEENEITELIKVGELPSENGYDIGEDVPEDILKCIFDYKYIDGEFVKRESADDERLEKLKRVKIESLSEVCRSVIIKGVDISDEHYSLEEHDQLNINDLKESALKGENVIYHADGGLFKTYTSEAFLALVKHLSDFKVFHNAYFNHLKAMIKGMTDLEEILNVSYGSPLTPDLQKSFDDLTKDMQFEIISIEDTTNYDSILYISSDY